MKTLTTLFVLLFLTGNVYAQNPFGKAIDGLLKKDKNEKTTSEDGSDNNTAVSEDEEIEDSDVEVSFEENEPDYDVAPNEFIGSFSMEVTEYKKGKMSKDSPMKIHYYFDEYKIAFIPEAEDQQSPTLIYDLREKTITTLVDDNGEKSGMKMKMPKIKVKDKDGSGDLYGKIEKTDETKAIDGYQCRKYLIENEDTKGYAWVTEDMDINYGKLFSFISMDKGKNSNSLTPMDIQGIPLESHTESKKKNEAYDSVINNIKSGEVDESIFDTSEYEITDMSNLMRFGQDN